MQSHTAVLVLSARPEKKKSLLRILEDLPVNVFGAATLTEAREVLSEQSISVVFCEARVSDGRYLDLLTFARAKQPSIQFVVMLGPGEWSEYMNARGFGAAKAVRWPLEPADVESALIHAMRKQANASATRPGVSGASQAVQ
jgi:DNA-binding NtrC family response regulator